MSGTGTPAPAAPSTFDSIASILLAIIGALAFALPSFTLGGFTLVQIQALALAVKEGGQDIIEAVEHWLAALNGGPPVPPAELQLMQDAMNAVADKIKADHAAKVAAAGATTR